MIAGNGPATPAEGQPSLHNQFPNGKVMAMGYREYIDYTPSANADEPEVARLSAGEQEQLTELTEEPQEPKESAH